MHPVCNKHTSKNPCHIYSAEIISKIGSYRNMSQQPCQRWYSVIFSIIEILEMES